DLGDPRIGLPNAGEDQVLIRVVGPADPGRTAVTGFKRNTVPAVALGGVAAGNGVDAPELFAGFRIMAGDKATAWLAAAAPGHALDHDAIGHNGTAGEAVAVSGIGDLLVPDKLAGLGVKRDQVGVARGDIELVLIDRLGPHAAGADPVRKVIFIFPDQVAGGAIKGLN